MTKKRCHWVGKGKDFYDEYHDSEWGVPVHDDRKHFEFLILEGAQAGLSWETILKRREGYRKAFKDFDPSKIARMTDGELEKLLKNPSIIRNRLKVFAARKNAHAFLAIQKEYGSFDKYVWEFVGGKPIINAHKNHSDIPVTSKESDALSVNLKKRGMSFVGSIILYAYMQATGLINNHLTECFRYSICKKMQ
ncbi:MAG: DNA-3-methyladenine glycosylase I [Alphaproteobacteria bacterium]|nr:DNA-3-methyladenine glycosylase I [Alphaproteobacteria bacterium]MCK5517896.1 DNA-3-methyladenine glycosylase I [Alphaproteobacteria bacterium]MCK5659364.1 DNA-3-methyladenine glycosylase I [Alphaproteobacteria bacterium]